MIDTSYNGQIMTWTEIKHQFPEKIVCLINAENKGTKALKGTICGIVDTVEERDNETIRLHKEGYNKLYWRYTTNPQETMGVVGVWGQ